MRYQLHKQYRLPGFDYSSDGYYFVTIVTKNRKHFFGEVVHQEMILSPIGEYLKENILKFLVKEDLPNPYQDNIYFINNCETLFGVTEWSILPDHIHLIIEIVNKVRKEPTLVTGIAPLAKGSLGSFCNHFKGTVTRWCRDNDFGSFRWHGRFHDRIIRDEAEYDRIAWYIQNNVLNWVERRNPPEGEFVYAP